MGAGRMVPFENGLFASPEGRSFVCAIPMPFQKSAKMTLFNGTGRDNPHLFYDVDLTMEDLPGDAMRFHAAFTCSRSLPLGRDVPVLPQVQGQGRFLGMNVAIQINPAYGESWWGEGEVKVYLDGEEAPSLVGTGTEDYIGTAWGQGEFVFRSQGCLHHREGGVSFYRFHLDDPVFFNRGCQVDIQDIGGCSIGEAKRLAEAGAELIPVGADTGGHMTHLYRRDWDWSQPETWVSWQITSAPFRNNSLITFETAFSFPGIGFELKIIVSFGFIVIFLCMPDAMRDNAAIDSPWLPVVIKTVCSSG